MRAWKNRLCVWLATACALVGAFSGCAEEKGKEISVYMPDGAPSLAFAKLMSEDTEEDGVTYTVVTPANIAVHVTYRDEDKNADLCVLPALTASKQLGDGARYQMLGVVTHGNLYLISDDGCRYTKDNLSALLGKTVGVLQLGNVPGLTLKSVLHEAGVPYQQVSDVAESATDKVNLLPISGASDVGKIEGVHTYLLAEPAVSLKTKAGSGYAVAADLQALYGGENGFPQAVLVAKKSVVESRGEWLQAFMRSVRASAAALTEMGGAEIVAAVNAHLADGATEGQLNAATLTSAALSGCGVYLSAANRTELDGYLSRLGRVSTDVQAVSAAFYSTIEF